MTPNSQTQTPKAITNLSKKLIMRHTIPITLLYEVDINNVISYQHLHIGGDEESVGSCNQNLFSLSVSPRTQS